ARFHRVRAEKIAASREHRDTLHRFLRPAELTNSPRLRGVRYTPPPRHPAAAGRLHASPAGGDRAGLVTILSSQCLQRGSVMKHLLTGGGVVGALALSAPVGANPANPSGGNAMGMPGPNPGGPGLTPYSTGPARPAAAPAPMAPPPAASAPPSAMSDTSSAMPPKHRHARATSHGKMAGHHRKGKGPQLTGSTANQLNQEELARLQAGNFSNPAAPMPPPPPRGPKTSGSSGAGPR